MPIRMVPDKGYEVVKIRYLILRGWYLGDSDKITIKQFLNIAKQNSKYPIEVVYTNNRVAEKFKRGKPPVTVGGVIKYEITILVQCVFKNPNILKRVYEPLLYCVTETIPFSDAPMNAVMTRMLQGAMPGTSYVREAAWFSNSWFSGVLLANNLPIFR